MISAIYNANVAIYDRAVADESLTGMGTTVVAAIVSGGSHICAHAGGQPRLSTYAGWTAADHDRPFDGAGTGKQRGT